MKHFVLAAGLLALLAAPAFGQGVPNTATVTSACGTPIGTYTAGQNKPILQDTTGRGCVATTATVTGTVTANQGTPNAGAASSWPVQGAGTAGTPAEGVLSIQGVVGGQAVPISGSITPSGTQDTNLKQVNGASVNVGVGAAGTGTQRVTTSSDSTLGLVAGTAIIGKVGIDQTTPGTTNGVVVNSSALPTGASTSALQSSVQSAAGTPNATALTVQGNASGVALPVTATLSGTSAVNVAQVNGVTTSTGSGAVGTGSQRVSVGQDTATIAGAAPGTTASPSSNVISEVKLTSAASTAGVAPTSSSALAANTVIKSGAGNLYSFQVAADPTLSGAAWWVMIYNATSAPADGSVTPTKCYALPLGATGFSGAFPQPVYFSTGITVGVSTTGCFTKTASTHAFISGDAQ